MKERKKERKKRNAKKNTSANMAFCGSVKPMTGVYTHI